MSLMFVFAWICSLDSDLLLLLDIVDDCLIKTKGYAK